MDRVFCRLNLLIAIMGDSYEKVKDSERVEAIRERASIIVDAEKWFPKSHQYARFMHVVEAVSSAGKLQEMEWEGVTKRVSQMLSLEVGRLEQNQQELDDKMIELDGKMIELDGKMIELNSQNEQLKSEMNSKFEQMELRLEMILDRLK